MSSDPKHKRSVREMQCFQAQGKRYDLRSISDLSKYLTTCMFGLLNLKDSNSDHVDYLFYVRLGFVLEPSSGCSVSD